MTKTYCDRCGSEIKDKDVNQVRLLDYAQSDKFINYDICQECTKAFKNLMAKKVLSYADLVK
jgi:hypothetical protein